MLEVDRLTYYDGGQGESRESIFDSGGFLRSVGKNRKNLTQ